MCCLIYIYIYIKRERYIYWGCGSAEAVSRGLEAEALQLPEDEGAEVRRHNIQDLRQRGF